MAISRLFQSSRPLLWAASIALFVPLMLGGAAAVAETAKTNRNVKPTPSRNGLNQVDLSGRRGAPSRRFGGGSRVGNGDVTGSRVQNVCATGPQSLAMISPADNVTVTTSEKPSLMFWVNESQYERDVEFALREGAKGNGPEVYRKILKLSEQSGLVTVDMSELEDAPSLTKGKDYYVYFSLVCDASDRSKEIVVEGRLNPVALDSRFAQVSQGLSSNTGLNALDPFFQIEQSVEMGLWHDAMVQLNHLRQEGSSPAIRQQAQLRWQTLLEADSELKVIAAETNTVVSPLAIVDVPKLELF